MSRYVHRTRRRTQRRVGREGEAVTIDATVGIRLEGSLGPLGPGGFWEAVAVLGGNITNPDLPQQARAQLIGRKASHCEHYAPALLKAILRGLASHLQRLRGPVSLVALDAGLTVEEPNDTFDGRCGCGWPGRCATKRPRRGIFPRAYLFTPRNQRVAPGKERGAVAP